MARLRPATPYPRAAPCVAWPYRVEASTAESDPNRVRYCANADRRRTFTAPRRGEPLRNPNPPPYVPSGVRHVAGYFPDPNPCGIDPPQHHFAISGDPAAERRRGAENSGAFRRRPRPKTPEPSDPEPTPRIRSNIPLRPEPSDRDPTTEMRRYRFSRFFC